MVWRLESGVMISHLRYEGEPLFIFVCSCHVYEFTLLISTHAVTPLENSTSLQLVLFAETKAAIHQNIPIRPRLNKSFLMMVE